MFVRSRLATIFLGIIGGLLLGAFTILPNFEVLGHRDVSALEVFLPNKVADLAAPPVRNSVRNDKAGYQSHGGISVDEIIGDGASVKVTKLLTIDAAVRSDKEAMLAPSIKEITPDKSSGGQNKLPMKKEPTQGKTYSTNITTTMKQPYTQHIRTAASETAVEETLTDGTNKALTNTAHSNVTKVLLLTYMRGGSSVLGELFNRNQKASYWFEPVDGVYSDLYGTSHGWFPIDLQLTENGTHRHIPREEEDAIVRAFQGMYSCQMKKLPTDLLGNYQFLHIKALRFNDYIDCVNGNMKKNKTAHAWSCKRGLSKFCERYFRSEEHSPIDDCAFSIKEWKRDSEGEDHVNLRLSSSQEAKTSFIESLKASPYKTHRDCLKKTRNLIEPVCSDKLVSVCQNSSIIAAKTIRMRADTVFRFMQEFPGLKVVYYVRDPRGVVPSRKRAGLLSHAAKNGEHRDQLLNEAALLCERMRTDLPIIKQMSSIYPGQVYILKYEDFATNTEEVAKDLYNKFLHEEVPPGFTSWYRESQSLETDKGAFSTARKNSTETAYKWRTSLTPSQQKSFTKVCEDVLRNMGYQL